MRQKIYRSYLLGVLLIVLMFNYQERAVTSLALDGISRDLKLSDTRLGLISGVAFALFYSVLGVQISRWADTGNRVKLLGATTAIWGAMVALCGGAASFVQLLVLRAGVGIGEAGCMPIGNSLLAENFDRNERPRALSIFLVGGWLSMVIGYFLGGLLIERLGWRHTYVWVGLAGLPLAFLVWHSLREPRTSVSRAGEPRELVFHAGAGNAKAQLLTLWETPTFRYLLLAFCGMLFFAQGIWQWQSVYFLRRFSVPVGRLGTELALAAGLPGVIGGLIGGELAARWAPANERLQLRAMAVAVTLFALISACAYLTSSLHGALVLVGLATLGGATVNGPLFAAVQAVVPDSARAFSVAVIYLFANLLGMGLGPYVTGSLSDFMRPWAGDDSLRLALLTLCPGYLGVAWLLWRASRDVMLDVEAVARAADGATAENR